jgi:hypothetical protein
MKQRFTALLLGIFMLGLSHGWAQTLTVDRSDYSQAIYTFTAPQPSLNIAEVDSNTYTVVGMSGATPSTHIGRPNLPHISQMIEIPLCEDVEVSVSNIHTRGLNPLKYPMIPVQPAPSKANREPLPFVIDSAFYATDAFTDTPAAWVEKLGIGRDRNLAILRISPISYNPVSGEMQMITSMTITLTYRGCDVAATQTLHSRYHSPDFALGNGTLNTLPGSKSVRNDAPLHYLIVAHNSFRGALDSFIAWKKRQGFIVTVGYTGDAAVGTSSTSIANYTKSFYTNASDTLPAPTFLLLVGDHQQIPAFNSRCTSPDYEHVTDLYYATWTVGDDIPDCYMGRFSARTLSELTPQIEKTIYYESYAFDDDSYLGNGVLIAGVDRGYSGDNAYSYADPAMDYIAKTYINASNGYNNVHYYKNNINFAPTGVHVDGSSQTTLTANNLRALYNEGCGWVNYSAHGYDDEWSTPTFSTSHVNNMTNQGKPAIMVGNCCLSGKFNTNYSDACLGEALLRKGGNAGAVAYFGATNSTYWPQDFCWAVGLRSNISNTMNTNYEASHLGMYDRLFHTHGESYSAWHTTAGSINVAGNMAVEMYGTYNLYYWEIYELFGDPSLMPWLSPAAEMTLEFSPVISVSSSSYTVKAVPHAYVAITSQENHSLICAAYANEAGEAHLTLPADLVPGTYELVAWAQNRKPVFEAITVAVLDGPYVLLTNIEPIGEIHPGEIIYFDFTITNVGRSIPTRGLVTLSDNNGGGSTIIQPIAHFTECNPGDTVTLHTVCPVLLSDNLKDGETLRFSANVDFGTGTSTRNKAIQVTAPRITVSNAKATPLLTPDSASTITCRIANVGSYTSESMTLTLTNDYGFINQQPDPVRLDALEAGDSRTVSFYLSLNSDVPQSIIPFYLYATTDNGSRLLDTLFLSCGVDHSEDFETGTFTANPWIQSNHPWEITSSNVLEGSYSARSQTNMGSNAESKLSIIWDSPENDSISFYYKVSSEDGYDLFRFLIDGVEKLSASGEIGWKRASYPVTAGSHIFGFSYTKDRYTVSGSDCAWIDNITFPFTGNRCQFSTDQVCQNTPYEFAGHNLPTSQTGTFPYSDTTTSPWQYLTLSVVDAPDVSIEVIEIDEAAPCRLLVAHGADRYVWNTGDSTNCIAVCPDNTATYTVTGYRATCSGEASTTLLSIEQPTAETNVSLYPNPAHNQVTITADNLISIELINIMGQVITRKPTNANSTTLDLQKLPNGIYFVRIETPNSWVTRKLVKK